MILYNNKEIIIEERDVIDFLRDKDNRCIVDIIGASMSYEKYIQLIKLLNDELENYKGV